MEKNIIIYLVIIILTIVSIYLLLTIPMKKNNSKSKVNNDFDSIPEYQESNLKRYKSFQEHNLNLSKSDVVKRVNMNLDYKFYTHTKKAEFLNDERILVNKYYYLTADYVPDNLETISELFSNGNKQLVKEARISFEEMANVAYEEGFNLRIISAYRSYEYQQNLYNNYVKSDGKKKADTYSARPGFSEHQTGLSFDIDNKETDYNNFEQTDEFKWMQKNAYKFGFILRYPKNKEDITGYQYEAWHYRYVGKDISKYIHKHNITLEEYYAKKLKS